MLVEKRGVFVVGNIACVTSITVSSLACSQVENKSFTAMYHM